MRINGWGNIPHANISQDEVRHRESQQRASNPSEVTVAKSEGMRDTVEISYKPQLKANNTLPKEVSPPLSQFRHFWKHTKEKLTEWLLKVHVLKQDEIDPNRVQFNPYVLAEIKRDLQSWVLYQKVKYRVQAIAQSLVKWFAEFFGGNSMTEKEEDKDELHEKELIEEKHLENRDESHLLTSYNRKGEPTQLTTKK